MSKFRVGDTVKYRGGDPWLEEHAGQFIGDVLTVSRVIEPHYIAFSELEEAHPKHNRCASHYGLVRQAPTHATLPTNPKQAFGDKKVPLHLIPTAAMVYESLAYKSGALKYGTDNYRSGATKVEAMTYIGGAKRHIEQWVSGEEVDPKELVHHLGAARASLGIIIAAMEQGTLIDNRPPKLVPKEGHTSVWTHAESVVEHLNNLYPPKQ